MHGRRATQFGVGLAEVVGDSLQPAGLLEQLAAQGHLPKG
jgi:hypothetical protein